MLSAEPAKGFKCRIPADTDAAIRISQVLQLASLVQVAQQQVHHLQSKLCPDLHGVYLAPITCASRSAESSGAAASLSICKMCEKYSLEAFSCLYSKYHLPLGMQH